MTEGIQPGTKIREGGEAVAFGMVVNGEYRACLVSREVLNDLSKSDGQDMDVAAQFYNFRSVIAEMAEKAIRSGLAGNPLLVPAEMFFPLGRPAHHLYPEDSD